MLPLISRSMAAWIFGGVAVDEEGGAAPFFAEGIIRCEAPESSDTRSVPAVSLKRYMGN